MAPPYVDLHLHTDNSLLDGMGTVPLYVARAKKQKKPALGITDHGTLSGCHEFYLECLANGIEPILGSEFYFVPNAAKAKEDKNLERFHVVILAKNLDGYRTLCALSTEAHRRFYGKPLLDRALLEGLDDEAENLVVLSGCAGSIISRKAIGAVPGSASTELAWWRETFPNFYIELQHHGTENDRKLNRRLLQLASRYQLPWVVTNDPHYVMKEDDECHDALLAVQTGSQVDDEVRFRFDGSGYHLRSRKEMVKAFNRYGAEVYRPGIAATSEVARSCRIRIPQWDQRTWHIPKYVGGKPGVDSFTLLRRITRQGLRERGLEGDPAYVERAKYELRRIKQVGIADFLLITRDIIQRAVAKGIPVGPGRGSTAGSLVGYLTGIHKVDSVRYDLLFERFLNPERPKMPDIDTDFSQLRRDEVIQDIVDVYGAENVLHVAAFQTLKIRGAFRKMATAYGMPFKDLKHFTDLMAEAWGHESEEDEDEEDYLGTEHLPDEIVEEYPELIPHLDRLIGIRSALSRHPAGVLIFDPEDDIRDLVPEMWTARSKKFVSMYPLKSVEKIGLMKQDILGLRNLDTIAWAVDLIAERTGERLDPDSWVPDEEEGDKEIYRMLAKGGVHGVFQLEGKTMAKGIQEIKPTRFEDIVSCTALYRAGPIIAGAPKRFLKNRKDKKVRVLHPSLKPILGNTWGEMIYQEQMMKIANEIAGFNMAKVDDIKEVVRWKDPERMAGFVDEFVQGCVETTGMDRGTAGEIWKFIEAQSSYLFNRSHAVSYSLLTYQTAHLRMWYPLEYFTALMATIPPKKENRKKREATLAVALDMGIKILPPDINQSGTHFTCGGDVDDGDAWMRFGLIDIKGIGDAAAKKIIAAKEGGDVYGFFSPKDLIGVVPKNAIAALDAAGALSEIGGKKKSSRRLEELVGWQFNDVMAPLRKKYASKIKLPKPSGNSQVCIVGEIIETTKKESKKGSTYYTWRVRYNPSTIFAVTVWDSADVLWETPKGAIVMVKGKYQSEWSNIGVGDLDQVKILKSVSDKEAA